MTHIVDAVPIGDVSCPGGIQRTRRKVKQPLLRIFRAHARVDSDIDSAPPVCGGDIMRILCDHGLPKRRTERLLGNSSAECVLDEVAKLRVDGSRSKGYWEEN